MKKILCRIMAIIMIFSLFTACTGGRPKTRETVMGQDLSYWQERNEKNELGLCNSNIGYGGYSSRHTFGKNSYTPKIYELLASLEAEEAEGFDEAGYLDEGGIYYYLSLGDGSGNSLPARKDTGFRFYDDCRYRIPYHDKERLRGPVYEIKDPDMVREFLKDENAYVSPGTEEMLREKTAEFLRENDSLMKMAGACDDVTVITGSAAEGSHEELVPSEDNDISLEGAQFRISILPYPSETAAGTEGMLRGRISLWTGETDAAIDMTYALSRTGEYEITNIRVEMP